MNRPDEATTLAADAEAVVEDFIAAHRSGAIPALIGACVMWAVMHGGTEVVKGSLKRAIAMADEMDRAIKERQQ